MRILIVTAVKAEADAIAPLDECVMVTGGIGRTNAAAATTEALIRHGPFEAVICAGVAGALPGSDLFLGDAVVACACVYVEEGLITPSGFLDIAAMGFSLGEFPGNAVPVDPGLLAALAGAFPTGPIATVAMCSGTDEAATEVVRRTRARAEAMEGAAVVHAARRLRIPAIELRVISNTTGNRADQRWDLSAALRGLGPAVERALACLQAG